MKVAESEVERVRSQNSWANKRERAGVHDNLSSDIENARSEASDGSDRSSAMEYRTNPLSHVRSLVRSAELTGMAANESTSNDRRHFAGLKFAGKGMGVEHVKKSAAAARQKHTRRSRAITDEMGVELSSISRQWGSIDDDGRSADQLESKRQQDVDEREDAIFLKIQGGKLVRLKDEKGRLKKEPSIWSRPCCKVLAVCCGLLVAVVVLVALSLYDLYYLLQCATRKDGPKCYDIYRVHVSQLCDDTVSLVATVPLDNPSKAKVSIRGFEGTMVELVDGREPRRLGTIGGTAAFIQTGTGKTQNSLWYGRQNVSAPILFRVEDEEGMGIIGMKRMNKVDFSVEVSVTVRVGVTVTPLPEIVVPVTQARKYTCWNEAADDYRCHLGNNPEEEKKDVKDNNRTTFKMEYVEVLGDSDVGNNTIVRTGFAMDLGKLFITADVPALEIQLWYDRNNSDPMSKHAPTYKKDAFAMFRTIPGMYFHSPKFDGKLLRSSVNASLLPMGRRTAAQFADIQNVISDFLANAVVPIYARGPTELATDSSCMAQRVASKMPPFHLTVQMRKNKTEEGDSDPTTTTRTSPCRSNGTEVERKRSPFVIHRVDFLGVFHEKDMPNYEMSVGHSVLISANVSLRLPFLLYGIFPPLTFDIFSAEERWIGIRSPQSFVYTRAEAEVHSPIVAGIVATPLWQTSTSELKRLFNKVNSVSSISDLRLRVEGSQFSNAASRVLAGFKVSLGNEDDEGAAQDDTDDEDCKGPLNLEEANNLVLEIEVLSDDLTHVDGLVDLKVPSMTNSLPFPINIGAVNFTVNLNQSRNLQFHVQSTPFVLGGPQTADGRVPIFINIQLTAHDGGVELRKTVKKFVEGKSAEISVKSGGIVYDAEIGSSIPEGGGEIELRVQELDKYLAIFGDEKAATNTSTAQFDLELGRVNVFNLDTDGSTLDLQCLIAKRNCTAETMKIRTSVGMSVLLSSKLPIDISLKIPAIRVNAYEIDNLNNKAILGNKLGSVSVAGASYHWEFNQTGEFHFLANLDVPDFQRSLWILRPDEDDKNVSFLVRTETEKTLFESAFAEFFLDATVPVKGVNSKDSPEEGNKNSSITDLVMNANITTDAFSIGLDMLFQFRVDTHIKISVAGAEMGIWPYSEASGRRRLRETPYLDACYPHSKSLSCQLGAVSWNPFDINKDSLTEIRFQFQVVGSPELIGDVGNRVWDGGIVNPRMFGNFTLPSYAGPLKFENGPVNIFMQVPSTKEFDQEGKKKSASTTNASSIVLESIFLAYVKSIGQNAVHLQCVLGNVLDDPDCVDFFAGNNPAALSVGTVLNFSLPTMDLGFANSINVQLPKIGLETSIMPVSSTTTHNSFLPVGTLELDAVEYSHNEKNHLVLGVGVLLSDMLSCQKLLNLDAQYKTAKVLITGANREDTLVNKIMKRLNKNFTFDINTTKSSNSGATANNDVLKPVVDVTVSSISTHVNLEMSVTTGSDAYTAPFSLLVPKVDCQLTHLVHSGQTTLAKSVLQLDINPVTLYKNAGGTFTSQLKVMAADILNARDVIKLFKDGNNAVVHAVGTLDGKPHSMDLRLVLGVVNRTSSTDKESTTAAASFELTSFDVVGGASRNSNLRVPCILDAICPEVLSGDDANFAATLRLGFSLELNLPFVLRAAVSDVTVRIDDNLHNQIGSVAVAPVFIDTSTTLQSCELTLSSSTVSTIQTLIREIGTMSYRIYYRGDSNANLLGKMWDGLNTYVEMPQSAKNPNEADSVSWYLPTKEEGTWSLLETTGQYATIKIDFPLNWPVPVGISLNNLLLELGHQTTGKTKVVVGEARPVSPGHFVLRKDEAGQSMSVLLTFKKNSATGPSYCVNGLTYVDQSACALGDFISHIIARDEIKWYFDFSFTNYHGHNMHIALDATFFIDYWGQDWSRVQPTSASYNQFQILAPPMYDMNWGDTAWNSITSMNIDANLRLKLNNPFNFPLTVNRVAVSLGYDDVDGVGDDGDSYPIRTMRTNPSTLGNYLSRVEEAISPALVLNPGTSAFTPAVNVPVMGSVYEHVRRLYNEARDRKRVCLHVMDGLADISLTSGTPFSFSLPFQSPSISTLGDFDCDSTPQCDVWSHGTTSVFSFSNLGSSPTMHHLHDDVVRESNYLRLSKFRSKITGAFYRGQTINYRDSFRFSFSYKVQKGQGVGCPGFFCTPAAGNGDGFALVFADSYGQNGIGAAGEVGQGYKNFPGRSVGIALDTYINDYLSLNINGDMTTQCNVRWGFPYANPPVAGCNAGKVLGTSNNGGIDFEDHIRNVRVEYDGVRKNLYIYIQGSGSNNWVQLLQQHVDFETVFACTDVFSSSCGDAYVGFTASTGSVYVSETRIYSMSLEIPLTSNSRTVLLEDQRTLGALHDDRNSLFRFTLDAKDGCGHDRVVGMDSFEVELRRGGTVKFTLSSCGGENVPGVCPKMNTMVGSTDQERADSLGLYYVQFRTQESGWFHVAIRVNGVGSFTVIGRVYISP